MTSHNQRGQHWSSQGIHRVLCSYCGAMLAVLVASTLLLAGCAGGSQTATTFPPTVTTFPTPAATATPPAFPPFHEWRAAYIASDRQLHAVTLDGTNDAAGPYPSPMQDQFDLLSAGLSPDGHYLAFQAPTLTILDVTRRNASIPVDQRLNAIMMAWSPQGDTLAVETDDYNYVIIDAITGQMRHVPGTSSSEKSSGGALIFIGWIDAIHLAVTLWPSDNSSYTDSVGDKLALANPLGSLDITTGAVRPIATITSPPQASTSRFVLSPEGTSAQSRRLLTVLGCSWAN